MPDPVPVGKIPSGLFIVTVAEHGNRSGMLASWIQQVSFAPLMVSVCLQSGKPFTESLAKVGRFCVNIVGHQNNGLMKPFWGAKAEGDPFDGLATEISARGNLLLSDSMAQLECEVRSTTDPGDHVVIFAEVVESRLLKPEDKPMTHVRKTGAGY